MSSVETGTVSYNLKVAMELTEFAKAKGLKPDGGVLKHPCGIRYRMHGLDLEKGGFKLTQIGGTVAKEPFVMTPDDIRRMA